MITSADMNTYIQNDGSYPWGYASNQCMTFGDFTTHKKLYTQTTTTIGSGSMMGPYYSASFHTGTWTCTYHSGTVNSSPYSTSGTAQPPSTTTPMSIALAGLTLLDGSTGWQVDLYGQSTLIGTWTGTASTFSASVTAPGSGGVGVWQWIISGTGASPACDASNGVTGFGNRVSWTGTSYSYYT
jgi:hypothetical protein